MDKHHPHYLVTIHLIAELKTNSHSIPDREQIKQTISYTFLVIFVEISIQFVVHQLYL